MDAKAWDERYAATDSLWPREANQWVEHEMAGKAPGDALDIASGEGRNAIWLASVGWRVTAVDFSQVALDRGRTRAADLARERGQELDIEWVRQDLRASDLPRTAYDLVLVAYLHLPPDERASLLRACAQALRPGGTLLVVGHHTTNLEEGVGGPQDAYILFTAEDVVADLQDLVHTGQLRVERADRVAREVATDDGTAVAWDALVRATKPAGPVGGFPLA